MLIQKLLGKENLPELSSHDWSQVYCLKASQTWILQSSGLRTFNLRKFRVWFVF